MNAMTQYHDEENEGKNGFNPIQTGEEWAFEARANFGGV